MLEVHGAMFDFYKITRKGQAYLLFVSINIATRSSLLKVAVPPQ